MFDPLFILIIKLIISISFIVIMKKSIEKKHTKIKTTIGWILGLYFILIQSTLISLWILENTILDNNSLLLMQSSLDAMSGIIGIIIYLLIGFKYFSKKK